MRIWMTLLLIALSATHSTLADTWESQTPAVAKDPQGWITLMDRFFEQKKYQSCLMVAKRALLFFSDVQTKRKAFEQVIKIVDLGYSGLVLPLFVTADLEPSGAPLGTPDYDFANNYNFYKFILNIEKKLNRWASNFLGQIDQERFAKYLFYQALKLYQDKKWDEAEKILGKLLNQDFKESDVTLVKKIARTLARLRFEQKNYQGSLEIYRTFLLRTNPVNASDYIEAAWDLFYLGRYQEALGYLYNLESAIRQDRYHLEIFEMRGLIYRNLCADKQMAFLAASFRNLFNPVVLGIKLGVPLEKYPILDRIFTFETTAYRAMKDELTELKIESANLSGLKPPQKAIAQFLYGLEMTLLATQIRLSEDPMRERAAEQVLLLSEKIRFLKFEVVEQRFDPEAVFALEDDSTPVVRPASQPNQTELRWKQFGDFWRDERQEYRSPVKDQCKN